MEIFSCPACGTRPLGERQDGFWNCPFCLTVWRIETVRLVVPGEGDDDDDDAEECLWSSPIVDIVFDDDVAGQTSDKPESTKGGA